MSSSLLVTLEIMGVLGVVLALGGWELWSLRRDKLRDRARQAADSEVRGSEGHPDEGLVEARNSPDSSPPV